MQNLEVIFSTENLRSLIKCMLAHTIIQNIRKDFVPQERDFLSRNAGFLRGVLAPSIGPRRPAGLGCHVFALYGRNQFPAIQSLGNFFCPHHWV
jgi:hypothetical protein